jgi:2-oxoisovalerate dehydrogenase E1 component beta subunit
MTAISMAGALRSSLDRALAEDDRVVLLGEDIGANGGVFRVTDGLQATHGPRRVIDTPLAESGILGTAVGLAFHGFRPVCEIQFDGFVYPAFDQIVSQLAKMHYRTGGRVTLPITVRIPVGGGIGAAEHHSESPEAFFAHMAGIRTVMVSNPQDAATMLRQAIDCDDPVIFFEPKRRYHVKGEVDLDAVGLPLDAARVVAEGTDATVIAYGSMVAVCLDAAAAAAEEGVSLEVIDLRSLSPIDYDTVTASVRRTGRVVIVHEAAGNGGLGGEISATLTERCFPFLEAAPVRVTGHDIPYPIAKLEQHHLPDLDRVLYGVDRVLGRVPAAAAVAR